MILTNLPLGDCGGLYFEEGKKYLVYAFGKKLVAYGCRRNKKLEYASADMRELGDGEYRELGTEKQTTIVGVRFRAIDKKVLHER